MSDPNRPLSGTQSTLPGARMISPMAHGGAPPVTIPMVQNPYGIISAQSHQYMPHLTYTHLPNVQGRMPMVGTIPPSMSGMYVPVAQAPGTQVLVAQMPSVQLPASIVPQNVDPAKLLEQQRKLEKERNFQLQQQRLKQFTIAGKKGNINADNLIDSMFGKSHPKESSQFTSLPPKFRDSNESKSHLTSNMHQSVNAVRSSSVTIPSSTPIKPTNSANTTVPKQLKADKKELDAMMLECSDLKGRQKANKFSKPAVKEMTPSMQQRSTYIASNKSRNWNDVKGLDEVFVEKRPRFPGWCCKENVPEIFRRIESIVTENGTHAPETNLLLPILMSSNLTQPSLAHIWELVNLSAPGYLTVEEMYAALALIAVSQAGHVVKTADVLHQLPVCPIPQLQCFMNPVEATKSDEEKDKASSDTVSSNVDNVTKGPSETSMHQVIRPTSISLKNASTPTANSSAAMENHSNLPPVSSSGFVSSPDDEFDDFKSATPTCVNFFMYPNSTISNSASTAAHEEDEFDDFKQAPAISLNSLPKKEINIAMANETKSVEEQDLMSPEDDKYSVFRLLQHTEDSDNWGDFTSGTPDSTAVTPSNINNESLDNNGIKNESSLFSDESTNFAFDGTKVSETVKELKHDDDEFGDFLHAEIKQVPDVTVSKREAQDFNTDFADFSNFNENPPPLPTFNVCETVQADDDFGEFASSLPVVNKPETSNEFLFCNLKDNISLAESQSVSSLELGTFDGGGHSGESKSSLSRQGSLLSLDLKSINLEPTDGEDGFGEHQVTSTLNRTSKSPSPAKDVKGLEQNNLSGVSVGLNLQSTKSVSLTDRYSVIRSEERKEEDQHISSWTRCLQSSVNILQNTKKIFNQMSSSSICNEVLLSEEGGNYIKDVIEVYKVVCRVALSTKSFGKQTTAILDLLKEANQAWNTICGFFVGSPLMPQDLSFDFSAALLSADNVDNIKACGMCLLNVEIKTSKHEDENLKLSYGGRNYHSTCANFWVNCVDPLLPALILPQLL